METIPECLRTRALLSHIPVALRGVVLGYSEFGLVLARERNCKKGFKEEYRAFPWIREWKDNKVDMHCSHM